MSSDNQYTALGPAATGFQTDGANIDVGVEASGNKAGARLTCQSGYAVEAHSTEATAVQASSEQDFGVAAFGGSFGTYSRSQNQFQEQALYAGVLGEALSEGMGVVGRTFAGTDTTDYGHTAGVLGVSNGDSQRDPSNPAKLLGAGVVGLSASIDQIGIDQEGDGPFLPDLSQLPHGQGTGVWGTSGTGTGVHGESQKGNGVLGFSHSGRGGVFQTGNTGIGNNGIPHLVPQVNLVPQPMAVPGVIPFSPTIFQPSSKVLPALPAAGRGGDLLVTQDAHRNCTLWFCIHGQEGRTSAQWSQVLLGTPVPGEG